MAKKFQILDAEKHPISLNELDRQAAELWGQEVDPKYYATPNGYYYSWFDTIGYIIAIAPSVYVSWDEVRNALNPDQPEWFDLIDLWESKGYQAIHVW